MEEQRRSRTAPGRGEGERGLGWDTPGAGKDLGSLPPATPATWSGAAGRDPALVGLLFKQRDSDNNVEA